METLRPGDERELCEVVGAAAATGRPLLVGSRGGLGAFGRPVTALQRVDVTAFTGVLSYEPEELVLTVRAATPLADIDTLLAARQQCLAFEPPDLGPLLTGRAPRATIGSIVATGLSGPRRFKAGAARDHLLGARAVSGRGEAFTCGGRVVKNVTGYDLPKLLTGSHGTLAVLTELTLKVLPAPAVTRTLLLGGLAPDAAAGLMSRALGTAADVSAACHLPADVAARVPGVAAGHGALTALRLEGSAPSVEARATLLETALAADVRTVDGDAARSFWRAVGAVTPFQGGGAPLWRLSVPPARGGAVLERLCAEIAGAAGYLDWAGGLVWLQLPDDGDARTRAVRAVVAESGGHATLVRAAERLRATTEVFQPPGAAERALAHRIARQFDPAGVLNPGRMYAEP